MKKFEWIKSEASKPNGNCAEVMDDGFQISVRNSSDPTKTVLKFSYTEWDAFQAGVKNDEFDRKPGALCKTCALPLNLLEGVTGPDGSAIYVHSDRSAVHTHAPEAMSA